MFYDPRDAKKFYIRRTSSTLNKTLLFGVDYGIWSRDKELLHVWLI